MPFFHEAGRLRSQSSHSAHMLLLPRSAARRRFDGWRTFKSSLFAVEKCQQRTLLSTAAADSITLDARIRESGSNTNNGDFSSLRMDRRLGRASLGRFDVSPILQASDVMQGTLFPGTRCLCDSDASDPEADDAFLRTWAWLWDRCEEHRKPQLGYSLNERGLQSCVGSSP